MHLCVSTRVCKLLDETYLHLYWEHSLDHHIIHYMYVFLNMYLHLIRACVRVCEHVYVGLSLGGFPNLMVTYYESPHVASAI
jgi:hypothetical protein